jgi:putative FmdB family regulatory protein
MPTYEYHCDACGFDFEKFQSMSAEPVRKCPHCGKNKVKRLIGTGAGLIFKGSGFYITDYRDKSYADKAKADNGGGESKPAESTPAASGGGDAKPAKTEAPKPAATESKSSAAKAESPKAAKKEKKQ